MDSDEAREVGEFRRRLATATDDQLAPIILTTIDELINVVRGMSPRGATSVELAAALSAELHKRVVQTTVYAAAVGNA